MYNPDVHKRQSIRLKGYDYSQSGAYFVTICTWRRECLFGDVIDDKMVLNEYGGVVMNECKRTMELRSYVNVDTFIIMPNHFHGILIFTNDCRGTARRAPTCERFAKPISGSLPTIIRSFKSAVTKSINQIRNTQGRPVWQRNYYERVIRSEKELNQTREYIAVNPIQWDNDENNPENLMGCIP